jgi:hypothetical protein
LQFVSPVAVAQPAIASKAAGPHAGPGREHQGVSIPAGDHDHGRPAKNFHPQLCGHELLLCAPLPNLALEPASPEDVAVGVNARTQYSPMHKTRHVTDQVCSDPSQVIAAEWSEPAATKMTLPHNSLAASRAGRSRGWVSPWPSRPLTPVPVEQAAQPSSSTITVWPSPHANAIHDRRCCTRTSTEPGPPSHN